MNDVDDWEQDDERGCAGLWLGLLLSLVLWLAIGGCWMLYGLEGIDIWTH